MAVTLEMKRVLGKGESDGQEQPALYTEQNFVFSSILQIFQFYVQVFHVFSDDLATLAPNMHEGKYRGGRDDSFRPKLMQNGTILGHFQLHQSFIDLEIKQRFV